MMDNNTNIEIIEDKTLELEFIVHGESHGVCNALRHILMQDSDVEYAVTILTILLPVNQI